MIDRLESIRKLIKHFQQVPYLASKNLYSVINYFLNMEEERFKQFCSDLIKSKQNICRCPICFVWMEVASKCLFCSSAKRNQKLVCVVETWQELLAVEKAQTYDGVYHVLNGSICPLEGIGPEDLTINSLVKRADQVEEIIFAMNQTPEGEATAAYIADRLKNKALRITCLAKGLPVGSSLQYMDRVTLHQAIKERRLF